MDCSISPLLEKTWKQDKQKEHFGKQRQIGLPTQDLPQIGRKYFYHSHIHTHTPEYWHDGARSKKQKYYIIFHSVWACNASLYIYYDIPGAATFPRHSCRTNA